MLDLGVLVHTSAKYDLREWAASWSDLYEIYTIYASPKQFNILLVSTVPEFIIPVFCENKPKHSFSMTENDRSGLNSQELGL
jgi:hypothetical protein